MIFDMIRCLLSTR